MGCGRVLLCLSWDGLFEKLMFFSLCGISGRYSSFLFLVIVWIGSW